eukprot:2493571-Prymnesium_polylepis.1
MLHLQQLHDLSADRLDHWRAHGIANLAIPLGRADRVLVRGWHAVRVREAHQPRALTRGKKTRPSGGVAIAIAPRGVALLEDKLGRKIVDAVVRADQRRHLLIDRCASLRHRTRPTAPPRVGGVLSAYRLPLCSTQLARINRLARGLLQDVAERRGAASRAALHLVPSEAPARCAPVRSEANNVDALTALRQPLARVEHPPAHIVSTRAELVDDRAERRAGCEVARRSKLSVAVGARAAVHDHEPDDILKDEGGGP